MLKSLIFIFLISAWILIGPVAMAQTAIGGIAPDPSAMLDVQSTAKGVLFPRLTTTQRNSITSAATGLMIFNTSTRCLEINLGGVSPVWQNIKCTTCGAYVAVGQWKEFLCYNLGANPNIDPFTPSWELNGDYYQWGYKDKAAPGPSSADIPNSGNSSTFSADYVWNATAAANGAWENSTKTVNDPCPTGFRVPTDAQWAGVINNSLNPQVTVGASWFANEFNFSNGKFFGPALFLPAAGSRSASQNGLLSGRGSTGAYWSSLGLGVASFDAVYLDVQRLSAVTTSFLFNRRLGLSVRCIKE